MNWKHFFLPNKDTHQKAHLIGWEALAVYLLLYILLQVSFSITGYLKPGVLGTSSNIDQKKVVELVNAERAKVGLSALAENTSLDQAAAAKASNMFSENYWAHFAPSGRTPWDFILGSGYRFTFAGENLAKNFHQSDEVVVAWMNSSSHKENILNPKYKDIGIAVEDGILNGQKTTLVVQMFGTTEVLASVAQAPSVAVGGEKMVLSKKEYNEKPTLMLSSNFKPIIKPALADPYLVLKTIGLGMMLGLGALLVIDFVVMRQRKVFRLASSHLAHLATLSVAVAAVMSSHGGSIL